MDSVLYFEGDTHSSFRLVRAIKNRFGAVNEIGRFRDDRQGVAGRHQSFALFLSQHGGEVAGACVLVTQEGTRPLLVEIQALVDTRARPTRVDSRSVSSKTDSRCCWLCCIGMRVSPHSIRTCSSTRWAASRSMNRRRI